MSTLKYIRHDKNAITPTKGSAEAAGYDLHSIEDFVLKPHAIGVLPTGISVLPPEGCYCRIADRSGLAAKHGITTLAGVIDRDYRGSISVVLANLKDQEFVVNKGDRIAQLICEKIAYTTLEECFTSFYETQRGTNGLGSTGTSQFVTTTISVPPNDVSSSTTTNRFDGSRARSGHHKQE